MRVVGGLDHISARLHVVVALSGTVQFIGTIATIVAAIALEGLVDALAIGAVECSLWTGLCSAHEGEQGLTGAEIPALRFSSETSCHTLSGLGIRLMQRPVTRVLGDQSSGSGLQGVGAQVIEGGQSQPVLIRSPLVGITRPGDGQSLVVLRITVDGHQFGTISEKNINILILSYLFRNKLCNYFLT